MKIAGSLLFGISAALGASAAAPGRIPPLHYRLTALPAGAECSRTGRALNNRGEVVGDLTVGETKHAFLWRADRLLDLGTGGRQSSHAAAINDEGEVVGDTVTAAGRHQAFLYQREKLRELPGFGRGESVASGINNRGDIVGTADDPGNPRAFLYRQGRILLLDRRLGSRWSYARAINNRGQIAGDLRGDHGDRTAYLYSQGRVFRIASFGGPSSEVGDLNRAGQVVGTGSTRSLGRHAFLFGNGTRLDLEALPGYGGSLAYGINNHGDVVGEGNGYGEVYTQHAFVYRDGWMRDLNDYIPADTGWTLETALSINDQGQIVGAGRFNGRPRTFLLTPD